MHTLGWPWPTETIARIVTGIDAGEKLKDIRRSTGMNCQRFNRLMRELRKRDIVPPAQARYLNLVPQEKRADFLLLKQHHYKAAEAYRMVMQP